MIQIHDTEDKKSIFVCNYHMIDMIELPEVWHSNLLSWILVCMMSNKVSIFPFLFYFFHPSFLLSFLLSSFHFSVASFFFNRLSTFGSSSIGLNEISQTSVMAVELCINIVASYSSLKLFLVVQKINYVWFLKELCQALAN